MSTRTPVGVLVSGAGTNLEALLRACADPGFPARITLVISNRRDAPALDIARDRGVPAEVLAANEHGGAAARDHAMLLRLHAAGVRLVVCAGYDRILSDEFLAAFPDAILNVHPSLLPAFAGSMHAVQQALEHGVKLTGCTVQLLQPGETDGGPIVLQAAVPVRDDDTVDSLLARVHEQEWTLLPRAVALWCEGRLRREGRRVLIRGETGSATSTAAAVAAVTPPRPMLATGLPPAARPVSPPTASS